MTRSPATKSARRQDRWTVGRSDPRNRAATVANFSAIFGPMCLAQKPNIPHAMLAFQN